MVMGRRYWAEEVETMPMDKLRELQGERLQELVTLAYNKSALYRRKLDEVGVKPADIRTTEDITKLPFTEDSDIRGRSLEEKLTIPISDVKMFSSTSGTTTGIPEPLGFSKEDTALFLGGEARAKWTIGVRPDDVVQIMTR